MHAAGKKILGLLMSEEGKIKRGKIESFSVKIAIFKGQKTGQVKSILHVGWLVEWLLFFLVGPNSSS